MLKLMILKLLTYILLCPRSMTMLTKRLITITRKGSFTTTLARLDNNTADRIITKLGAHHLINHIAIAVIEISRNTRHILKITGLTILLQEITSNFQYVDCTNAMVIIVTRVLVEGITVNILIF